MSNTFSNIKYMNERFFQLSDVSEEHMKLFAEKHGTNLRDIGYTKTTWYPKQNVFELKNCSRNGLKKCEQLKPFHKVMSLGTESGMITRQELVSMLPPLFLDIEPSDLVLDICASPGSKTTQILELLSTNFKHGDTYLQEGGVIANDIEKKRTYTLSHRISRLSTPGMAVINHDGVLIPTIYNDAIVGSKEEKAIYFDKVMVDAPCSGDGAIRKLPMKWKRFETGDGLHLHTSQVNLVKRGLQLLKIGGILVYSTCSMNPVENEAVVAEVMRIAEEASGEGALVIENCHQNKLHGLVGRKGMLTWNILEKLKDKECKEQFVEYSSKEDKRMDGTQTKDSHFPPDIETMRRYNIENTMRILPHDQDTGGFFICKFVKKRHINISGSNRSKYRERKPQIPVPEGDLEFVNFPKHQADIWQQIQCYYGLPDVFQT